MHWITAVNDLMLQDYAIDLDDTGLGNQQIQEHFVSALPPRDFVDWFGSKYDLQKRVV
jgi:hypothetical protein